MGNPSQASNAVFRKLRGAESEGVSGDLNTSERGSREWTLRHEKCLHSVLRVRHPGDRRHAARSADKSALPSGFPATPETSHGQTIKAGCRCLPGHLRRLATHSSRPDEPTDRYEPHDRSTSG